MTHVGSGFGVKGLTCSMTRSHWWLQRSRCKGVERVMQGLMGDRCQLGKGVTVYTQMPCTEWQA